MEEGLESVQSLDGEERAVCWGVFCQLTVRDKMLISHMLHIKVIDSVTSSIPRERERLRVCSRSMVHGAW